MRVALMILLGLVIGIIRTTKVMNVLSERNPMPTALMHTMDYQMGQLKIAIKAKQCDAGKIQHHLSRLASTATDITPIFGTGMQDFTDHAHQLQDRLQQAVQTTPVTCAALAAAIKPVNESCDSCHRKYR